KWSNPTAGLILSRANHSKRGGLYAPLPKRRGFVAEHRYPSDAWQPGALNMTIRGFLIDLDGAVYTGANPVPAAREALMWLSREGYPFRFVSNTTRRSQESISHRLAEMHLDIRPDIIFTPAVAAASLI